MGKVLAASLGRIVKPGAAVVAKRFARRDPFAAQRKILAGLIEKGAATRFGREHGLADLAGRQFDTLYRNYRERVPIRTYEDFWRDYFSAGYRQSHDKRSINLDNVTWPGKIRFFCETSGTTAPTKFIPFSAEMFAANREAARDLAACYLHRTPESRLLPGKLLYMAGNTRLTDLGGGAVSGDMSAITLLHPPSYLKPFIAPDPSLSALPWEEKLEALARLLLTDQGICAISGVPPWILLLLKRCTELAGQPLPEVLPNLELIIHGGTSMKPYCQEFAALFGTRPPICLELLPSSEAFMAFQLPGEEQMRFTPYYGVFFEFVPFEELDDRGVPGPDAAAVPLAEVQAGKRYAVILTTCAGLWRYHIGDTIRFVSLDPLLIEFTGRDKFLDRFEEKVTQGEAEEAIAALNRMEGVDIREFMVGPDIPGRRHLWILAMGRDSSPDNARLAACLDGKLREMNADYATFRNQGRIGEPLVVTVSEEMIYRWSKEVRGKLGGQSKIPHIDPTVDGEMIKSLHRFTGIQANRGIDAA
ncbi:MAG: GH3 auxin-responsive promoter family protein [Geobacteraceae bacterium]|nr:GH3 auxin-responsive promoter family protein [Geobacteraceae bacterium]